MLGAIIGLVGTLAGAGISAAISKRNQKKQEEENELNRQHETDLNDTNVEFQREQNELNRLSQEKMNEQNAQTLKDINDQNIKLQQQTNQQNLELTREQWKRDDTTYQRTVADMARVGLSPLAMQGLNGNSGAMQMNAPTVEASQGEAYQGEAPQVQQHMSYKKMMSDPKTALTAFSAIADGMNQIEATKLQNQKLRLEEMQTLRSQLQAKSQLAETIRHNKEMEKAGNWKNIVANRVINKLLGDTAEGKEGKGAIAETVDAIKNTPMAEAADTMFDSLSATATGNKQAQEEAYESAMEWGEKYFGERGSWGKWLKEKWDKRPWKRNK